MSNFKHLRLKTLAFFYSSLKLSAYQTFSLKKSFSIMEQIITYFSHIPSSHRSLILVSGITLFWVLEGVIPLILFQYHKWKHAGINIFFTITTILVNFCLAFMLLWVSDWVFLHKIGILYMVDMPLWLFMLLGVMGLDLIGAYFVHWAEHKVRLMWRFHLIHHTDTYVDTTTANRHHPGESIFRFLFTMLAILVMGAPIWVIMLYQSLSVVFSQFNHANISLPAKLDYILSYIIVSPNMHKVHHHYIQPYTDSNYGNIFAIWDRIFGTFMYLAPENIKYGVDTHLAPEENSQIDNLLKIPFQKYRTPSD